MSTTTLFYVFHLFLGVVFPIKTSFLHEKKWKLKLHVIEGLSIAILSTLAPVVYISTSGYTIAELPTEVGQPTITVAFYTLVLPVCIVLAVGTNLTLYTFYHIHKVRMNVGI